MNALLQHVWGKSAASDRVWAQVASMRPADAVRRVLMALEFQAFMDESCSSEEFVLAGYIQTAENWANFAVDWDGLLPLGTKASNGNRHFKMSEMAYYGKMADVQKFSEIIDKHELRPVSFRMNMDCFRSAQAQTEEFGRRLGIGTINWGLWDNPYYFAFRHFLTEFHSRKDEFKIVAPDEIVDFYFDDRTESAPIMTAWSEIREQMPEEVIKHFGTNPRFENDQKFLGLQAADFWAWWVRTFYEEDNYDVPTKLKNGDFGTWRAKKTLRLIFSASEQYIFEKLKELLVESMADGPISFIRGDGVHGQL